MGQCLDRAERVMPRQEPTEQEAEKDRARAFDRVSSAVKSLNRALKLAETRDLRVDLDVTGDQRATCDWATSVSARVYAEYEGPDDD